MSTRPTACGPEALPDLKRAERDGFNRPIRGLTPPPPLTEGEIRRLAAEHDREAGGPPKPPPARKMK